MDKWLITGGAGFIGSATARMILKMGLGSVRVLDNFSTGSLDNLRGLDVELIEGDVRDEDDVRIATQGVHYVLHLAAFVSAPKSVEEPFECLDVNAFGTALVLSYARLFEVDRTVIASSCAVLGDRTDRGWSGTAEGATPYARSKSRAESLARSGKAVILRYFNVYGPGQKADGTEGAVVPAFVDAALAGEDLVIHGDGLQTRDFVHVEDVAKANIAAATTRVKLHNYPPIQVGTGVETSILDLARLVRYQADSESRIAHVDGRPGDIRRSFANEAGSPLKNQVVVSPKLLSFGIENLIFDRKSGQ